MSGHTKWRELRAERENTPEHRGAYERARRAYEIDRKGRELRETANIGRPGHITGQSVPAP